MRVGVVSASLEVGALVVLMPVARVPLPSLAAGGWLRIEALGLAVVVLAAAV